MYDLRTIKRMNFTEEEEAAYGKRMEKRIKAIKEIKAARTKLFIITGIAVFVTIIAFAV